MFDVLSRTCGGRHDNEGGSHGKQADAHGSVQTKRRHFRHHAGCRYCNAGPAALQLPSAHFRAWNTPCDVQRATANRRTFVRKHALRHAAQAHESEADMDFLQLTAGQWIGLILLAAGLVVVRTASNRRRAADRRGLDL
jgi:hypothetical protein